MFVSPLEKPDPVWMSLPLFRNQTLRRDGVKASCEAIARPLLAYPLHFGDERIRLLPLNRLADVGLNCQLFRAVPDRNP